MLCAWAIDDGPVQVLDLTAGFLSPELDGLMQDHSVTVVIHNSHFDRTVIRHAWGYDIPTSRIHDTMIQALSHSLPASLGDLCTVLGLPADKAKDKDGKRLINLFCKPLGKNRKLGRATCETHPEEWQRFKDYAASDVEAMREVMKRMPTVNTMFTEKTLWELDQRINDRGVAIDMPLVDAAIKAVELAQVDLAAQTAELTEGAVASTTKTAALRLQIFEMFGIDMPNMQMATVEKAIEDPSTPPAMAELLTVRLQASSTSTSKYKVLKRGTSADGRLRGTLQFNGASRTGRWAGRLFQPQNLPRPTLKQPLIDAGIEALKAECAHLTTDNVMALTSSSIRSCIVAPYGKKLVVADLSNIEGRVQAWLANEEWKLQAFRDYDTITGIDAKGKPVRRGHDLYKLAYAKAFGITPESVTDDQRQIGKVMELALGYEGGVGAFATFANTYGIDLEDLAQKVLLDAPEDIVAKADNFLEWTKKEKRPTHGLSDDAFVACDVLKRMWRDVHPNTRSYWGRFKDAVIMALNTRGTMYTTLGLKIKASKNWLIITMPSGRSLCYPSPKLVDGAITYMGIDQFTRKWVRQHTHGGKLFENCIAKGTEVLTEKGWMPIEDTHPAVRVWDGVEWVAFSACVYKGKQTTMTTYGVEMTPDHLVLTEQGWKNASSCKGHNRAACGLPDGFEVSRQQREKIYVGSPLPMRKYHNSGSERLAEVGKTRGLNLLRLFASGVYWKTQFKTRDESPSGLCSMAGNAGQMSLTKPSSIQKLWWAGNNSVRKLAGIIRQLLVGHGAYVCEGSYSGTIGQFRGIHAKKLCVENSESAMQQQAHQSNFGNTGRTHDDIRGCAALRYRPIDIELPGRKGLADSCGAVHATGRSEQDVYDLMDCGPRKRFVVRGTDGMPLIVHNCCQAVARDIMAANMPLIEDAGYDITLTVHDEIISEAQDLPEFNADNLAVLLSANPSWASDIPLAAAGFETYRYRKG